MTTVVPFPNDQSTREQAGMWIARLDRGLSDSECIDLQKWIVESPSHRAALLEMSRMWDRIDILAEISDLFPLESRGSKSLWRQWRPIVVAVACLTFLAIIPLAIWLEARPPAADSHRAEDSHRAAATSYQTEVAAFRTGMGQQRLITLSDHSIVALNTDSEMSVRYTRTDRMVELLRGEAHFKVAKDADRVFTVQVGDSQFKAVGTAFNLRRTSEQGVELTVMEGRVKVLMTQRKDGTGVGHPTVGSSALLPRMVDAGRELTINSAAQVVEALPPARIEAKVAWTHGMMVFDGESLERVVSEVSRYSTIKFVIASEDIKQIPVAGYFRIGDVDGLVAALQANFDINASREGGTIILRAALPK